MNSILDIKGFEKCAQKQLPDSVTAFFSRGAGDEITLEDNVSAFDRIKLLPRILKNVEDRSLLTTVLNQAINLPLLIAPWLFRN